MPNNLFNALGGNMSNHPMMQMVQKFNEFKRTFQGDPKAEVQKILQSGKVSQQDWNQIQSVASQFQNMLGMMK